MFTLIFNAQMAKYFGFLLSEGNFKRSKACIDIATTLTRSTVVKKQAKALRSNGMKFLHYVSMMALKTRNENEITLLPS
jgi:hypothetical protein